MTEKHLTSYMNAPLYNSGMLQGLKIWGGDLYMGAKILGEGGKATCLPPSDMPIHML